jgi:HD-GYP domain-containing protein (c-di-GMP phosphodiesterase class II)
MSAALPVFNDANFDMTFSKRSTAVRIAMVSMAMAAVVSPIAWYVARETAEDQLVAFADEESRRVIAHHGNAQAAADSPQKSAAAAAAALVGGIFEIAEIYDKGGTKLAEKHTALGERVEASLPKHGRPDYQKPFYESLNVAGDLWVVRVFVPLRTTAGALNGYFEGVRVVPAWQHQQIFHDALIAALMVILASLLCGAVIYPIVVRLLEENTRKTQEVIESHIEMMEALGRAIAKRDSDTGAHNFRVAWVAAQLGDRLGYSGNRMLALIAGSFLHDAGKIGIPDAILLKPGRLDAQETAIMRTHVSLGEEIVRGTGWLNGARDVVSCHHEKWDGSGYPAGLSGEAIPLSARIFAIADVFDALTSRRPYKEPFSFDESIRILQEGGGSHFDPALLERFLGIAADLYAKTTSLHENEMKRLMETMVQQHFLAAK